jgi:hypothetical protein
MKDKEAIHFINSKLQFHSKVFLAHIASVTNVLILLLLEHLRMAVICYGSISISIFL